MAGQLGRALRPRASWVPVLLSVTICAPMLLHRGFALVGDMVFVPHQPWKAQWLGADGSVPRSVPSDALASLLTQVIPGDMLQKAVLVVLLCAAGWGVQRLTRSWSPAASIVAAVCFVWNPWVYERLGIGDWALLCGYAALPWVVAGATRLRRDGVSLGAVVRLGVPVAAAALTSPTGGALATVLAVVVSVPRRAAVVSSIVIGVVVDLPWLLPGLLNPAVPVPARPGVVAFASHSDSPLGLVASVVSFGGIWKTAVAPADDPRLLYALVWLAVAVLGAGSAGVAVVRRRDDRVISPQLGVVALVGLLLALVPALPLGADLVVWLVQHVPGAGLLRDSQKWTAPYVLVASLGFGAAAGAVGEYAGRASARRGGATVVTALAVLPVLALPSLAWGLAGTFDPVAYPSSWSTAAADLQRLGAARARSVVLPWTAYRRFDFNHGHAVLDPAFRFFPGQVLTSSSLPIRPGLVVPGDNPLTPQLTPVLGQPAALGRLLRAQHVRFVIVERPAPVALPRVAGERVVVSGPDLTVLDLGGVSTPATSSYAGLYLVVDIVVGVLVAAAALVCLLGRARSRRERPTL